MVDQPTPLRRSVPHSTLTRDFADGTYEFGLTWPGMIELEGLCGGPLLPLLLRLSSNAWHVKDAPAVIRLGLVGAGLVPARAVALVRDYVETRPPGESVYLAADILRLALLGPAEVEAVDNQQEEQRNAAEG
jgi:tail tube GTA-gp10-like protein